MTKFLKKIFLYGILLSSVNYELVYSQGQSNIAVDLENNIGSNNNKLDTDMDVTWNNTIGSYDSDKYKIKDNILYGKVFCTLNPDAGNYGIFIVDCPYTNKITYNDKNYIVFPIYDNYYKIEKMNENYDQLTKANNAIFLSTSSQLGPVTFSRSTNYCNNDIATTTEAGYNIMCVKIGDIYKLDGTKILYNDFSLPLYKYVTKPNDTTMKWYKTINAAGDLPADPKDYTELNKAIFTITPNGELKLSQLAGGGGKLFSSK